MNIVPAALAGPASRSLTSTSDSFEVDGRSSPRKFDEIRSHPAFQWLFRRMLKVYNFTGDDKNRNFRKFKKTEIIGNLTIFQIEKVSILLFKQIYFHGFVSR